MRLAPCLPCESWPKWWLQLPHHASSTCTPHHAAHLALLLDTSPDACRLCTGRPTVHGQPRGPGEVLAHGGDHVGVAAAG